MKIKLAFFSAVFLMFACHSSMAKMNSKKLDASVVKLEKLVDLKAKMHELRPDVTKNDQKLAEYNNLSRESSELKEKVLADIASFVVDQEQKRGDPGQEKDLAADNDMRRLASKAGSIIKDGDLEEGLQQLRTLQTKILETYGKADKKILAPAPARAEQRSAPSMAK